MIVAQNNDLAALPPLADARQLFSLQLAGNPLVLAAADVDALLSLPRLAELELPAAAVPHGAARLKRGSFSLRLV